MSAVANRMEGLIGKPLLDDDGVSGDYVISKLKKVLLENLHFPRGLPTATKIADSDLKSDWATALGFAEGSTPAVPAQTVAAWNTAVDTAVLGISCSDSSLRVDHPDEFIRHLSSPSRAEFHAWRLG